VELKCIIIFGESGSGKTYTRNHLIKNFSITMISFDVVIDYLARSIENFFDGKEINHRTIKHHKLFESDEDLDAFLDDFKQVLQNNIQFFKKIYNNSIKSVDETFNSQYDYGLLGSLLNPFGLEIMNSLIKNLPNDKEFVLFEGVYFDYGTNYRKKIEETFNLFVNIQTIQDSKNNHFCIYNGEKINSIEKIITKIKISEFFDKNEIVRHPKFQKPIMKPRSVLNRIGKLKRICTKKN